MRKLKHQNVTKFKNLNLTRLRNPKYYKTQKFIMGKKTNSKTQNDRKLKKIKMLKTQKLKMWQNLKTENVMKTQNVTKLKKNPMLKNSLAFFPFCYMIHVAPDMWHLTQDMWHLTCDRRWEVNILWKFHVPSCYSLGVKAFWLFGGKGSIT